MPSAKGIEARPQPMKISGQGGSMASEPSSAHGAAHGTKPGGSHDQGVRNSIRLGMSWIGVRRCDRLG
jgi:hypothetical protein